MLKSQGTQQALGRIRAPRVHIQYEVYTGGATELRELPFVVGVLANLSGQPVKDQLPRLRDRKFVEIGPDNFDDVLAAARPHLKLVVDNAVQDDKSKVGVELYFNRMEDFEPEQIARRIPELDQFLKARDQLSNLLSKMEGSPALEDKFQEIVEDPDKLQRLFQEVVESTEKQRRLDAETNHGEPEGSGR